ncbi:keratin, type I cytoskeletal 19-like [Dendropsophus ebraccatus]|uniref:keratin, type I cytoskeletal 19-like n=1 Tax=Dendropsophus ebraccatus TaxID=150705 RepID=UPI003831099C
MQHLNDRLASYLEKVRSLEQENAQLERNIREWYEKHQPSSLPDFSCYFRTIQELQGQISSATLENARIVLQIDNARLAADDFKNKYEMELRLRNNVESDVNGLRHVLEELNREVCHLESQVQSLQEELLQMKRNHEEEVNSLRAQLGARVNVEVDAAPSMDLNGVLSEIREQYENLMDRNMREAESMFLQRSEELSRQMASGSEQLQSVQTEVIELRRSVQTLEIELQSQLSMKSALEGTLAETEATFGSQLSQLQCLINNIESELSQIRADLERQNHEYKILMDQKTHLEMEIATYKRLLEGHDIHVSGHHLSGSKEDFNGNVLVISKTLLFLVFCTLLVQQLGHVMAVEKEVKPSCSRASPIMFPGAGSVMQRHCLRQRSPKLSRQLSISLEKFGDAQLLGELQENDRDPGSPQDLYHSPEALPAAECL